jgi:ABC-type nitrate/sulfonate/bicarbonate transport system ATPase subunit
MANLSVRLSLKGISKNYGDTIALSPTDLNVDAGRFISIVGPSGCGKSTIFNIIAGVLQPSAGRILLDGRDVTNVPGQVGYMLQKDLLLPWRTVLENIVLGATLKGGATAKDRREGMAFASRYGLGDFIDHYPAALSGGMRQRVALMRTLAMHRDVLLLDEPFGALDSQTRLAMQQLLLNIWAQERRTILFVTHDVDEAIFLADRVIVMSPRPGKIQEILDVPLERPRPLACLTSPAFINLKNHVLSLIYSEMASFSPVSRGVAHG